MLPQTIDLTANRDFGFRSDNGFSVTIPFYTHDDDEIMSSDEYEALCKYEKIFGKKTHKNQVRELFGELYDVPFPIDWSRTCARCGKPIFPWNEAHIGICKDCDSEITQSYGFWNIPWNYLTTPRDTSSPMDIFSLR